MQLPILQQCTQACKLMTLLQGQTRVSRAVVTDKGQSAGIALTSNDHIH